MVKKEYKTFLDDRLNVGANQGFEPTFLPDDLFDFQKFLVDWAVKKGRGGIFADCGLGKTIMELVWCKNMAIKTNKPVLLLTPLAVAPTMKNCIYSILATSARWLVMKAAS